jgi:hypothetical protein
VRTDKEVGGKDGKTLLSDKAIFLSASEKNSKFAKRWKAQLTGMRKRAGRKEYKKEG